MSYINKIILHGFLSTYNAQKMILLTILIINLKLNYSLFYLMHENLVSNLQINLYKHCTYKPQAKNNFFSKIKHLIMLFFVRKQHKYFNFYLKCCSIPSIFLQTSVRVPWFRNDLFFKISTCCPRVWSDPSHVPL